MRNHEELFPNHKSQLGASHAARDTITRFAVVYFLTFMIPVTDLHHCVIGSCEMFFGVFRGVADLPSALVRFFLPVMLGNTVGGVVFVTAVIYAMTGERRISEHEHELPELPVMEWLFYRPEDLIAEGKVKHLPVRKSFPSGLHRLEENLGAAEVELITDDLREIEGAFARITVQGDRYPAHLQARVGR